ncbi:platelet-activating factor acetylhydrolase IB subunit gamma [Syngnathus typhle]|uniref:platelet-activating factor acetylhydrolase IB subunit gamma n=1 Tax=Syngnathus typhle TaxID=161592 RepID=UPI002A69F0BE|nr:platelet-activating factor acetylhydrolase IB subunit gamma [Syngnathus typhle]XP_061146137.1 platelet-activating factor acetylhydrolase IB subunit gamma [Syngnathus typhle]XP_061146138.1 platelet-activating factor acetylhydrolase IB subunit gamma [Syngnathus typhle]XP_061146139.1 platelet-activating factor acetylhydrolase IB subunit gamma [Syngnathus typhle]
MSADEKNPAATPTACLDTQGDGRWMSMHNRFLSDSKDKEPDVLFVGDFLVQHMHQFGVWRQLFSPLHALNFGVGSDATQHVLWRLTNGELDHISPKIVVLWVGTQNHGHTAEQICGGIMEIVQVVKNKLTHAHTLVLGLLPRGKSPNPLRERNAEVNRLVRAAVAGLAHASFLNVDPGFVHSNGSISHQDMYDYLHLSPQAYQAVCEPLQTHLKSMLDRSAEN